MLTGRGRTFVWDGENRPLQISNAANNTVSSYTYGPDGSRLRKTANTGPGGASQVSLYLGADLEYSPHPVTGVLQWTKYLSPEAKRVGSQTFWHHRDHLKSIRIVTDATGATTKRSTFRAYGDRGVEVKAEINWG